LQAAAAIVPYMALARKTWIAMEQVPWAISHRDHRLTSRKDVTITASIALVASCWTIWNALTQQDRAFPKDRRPWHLVTSQLQDGRIERGSKVYQRRCFRMELHSKCSFLDGWVIDLW
jgi:hypothetical protein